MEAEDSKDDDKDNLVKEKDQWDDHWVARNVDSEDCGAVAAERDNEPLQEFWPRAKLSLMPSIVNGDIVNPGDTITHPSIVWHGNSQQI